MGISCMKSCSSSPYAAKDSNPNPKKFTILSEEQIGLYMVLHVKYPDCTNFEGEKVLVYRGWGTSDKLLRVTKGVIDPHFNDSCTSPFARFKPTIEGLEAARSFCKERQLAKLDFVMV